MLVGVGRLLGAGDFPESPRGMCAQVTLMMLVLSVHHSVALQSWDLVPFNLALSEQATNKSMFEKQTDLPKFRKQLRTL